MTRTLAVTHSIISAAALPAELIRVYDIGRPVECRFLHLGLNDSYLVGTGKQRYVLRVYRLGWRSRADILYELDLLNHLARKGVPVSVPIATRGGDVIHTLALPEGERHAVLFTYAPGEPPHTLDEAYSRRYGGAVGVIHNSLDDVTSEHVRFPLDLEYLLDHPMQAILPFLEQRPDDAAYLLDLAARLKEDMAGRADTLERGACHGDVHGGNCHVSPAGEVTFFDFDCCGPGWRAFDLATFLWDAKEHRADDAIWTAFLEGYTERREVRDADLAAVPLFILLRQIWLVGLHTANGADWGSAWLDRRYFDKELAYLREREADYHAATRHETMVE